LAIDPEEADAKEAVMGCCTFYPLFSFDRGVHLYLDNIVVRKKHQRKGVAKALMHAVRECGLKEGLKSTVSWEVMDDNEGALALYRGLSPPCRFREKTQHFELKVSPPSRPPDTYGASLLKHPALHCTALHCTALP